MSLKKLYTTPGHLLRRCNQISVAIFLDECRHTDIRQVDFAVLSALEASNGVDQVTLSGLIAIDRSSIGRIADKLEALGLIGRHSDPNDRRIKRLHITQKGTDVFKVTQPSVERVQERILEPLTKEEKQQFMNCLKKITMLNNNISRAPIRLKQPHIEEKL